MHFCKDIDLDSATQYSKMWMWVERERETKREMAEETEEYTTLGASPIAHLVQVRLCNNAISRYIYLSMWS